MDWDPDPTRPDRIHSDIKNFLNVEQDEEGNTHLTMNTEAFDNTNYNKMYVKDLQEMAEAGSEESSSTNQNDRCDSTSKEVNVGIGVHAKVAGTGGGGGLNVGVKNSQETCTSALNSKSNRETSEVYGLEDTVEDSTTSASEAGLTEWTV